MAGIESTSRKSKPRVSKTDWLKAALDALEEGGIHAVRVERLAAQLKVAKSGFYYHFRDRDDLCDKLLDHWLTLDGTPFFKERLVGGADPEERLKIIADVVDRADLSRYDAAVRQWARQDPKVRRIWRKEMGKRLSHIRSMFEALGFEGDDLEMRTRSFVANQVSSRDVFGDLAAQDRKRLRDLQIALLTARP